VKSLVNDTYTTGTHSVVWNGTTDSGKSVASGIYFYRMEAGKYSATRKMALLK
jgi:flagellar hook assembly protein FlgD